ncbi:DUF4846 domain-containing protein [Niabella insulamsoli]|uniref:DUF4846 domain-containing protein n=1 Tax=Niabella insulamsoli TaxID=3144874 RepID=UPI0031FC6337
MKLYLLLSVAFVNPITCSEERNVTVNDTPAPPVSVDDIRPPANFTIEQKSSFAHFLGNIPLKKDNTVYLYDGRKKANQAAHYAVLDVSVGNKDLQQCADAIMRLRADWLFQRKQFDAIEFVTNSGVVLNFGKWLEGQRFRLEKNKLVAYRASSRPGLSKAFDLYLEFVFSYCGTASLGSSLKAKRLAQITAGDVFLEPGSPGHAVIVMATATDSKGNKLYLLAQSYMPAQDIHILKNPSNRALSPWYRVDETSAIVTPEWTFNREQLFGWKKN